MRKWSWIVLGLALLFTPVVIGQETDAKKTKDGFTIEVEVPRLGVISQDSTGTCWSYATVSFLEAELERIHKKKIDLSEMYTVYNAYLEKSRRYVRLNGKAQFSEGGLSHDVIELTRLFGAVPAEAYSGLCDGETKHAHGELAGFVETLLKSIVEAKKAPLKWEKVIRSLLDTYLGPIPQTIKIGEREMTPKEYADNVLKVPYNDYVEIMSFGYTPFWEEGELLVPDNWMRWSKYKNVPVDVMMGALDHALKNGYSVAVDMDVSEAGFKMQKGVAKLSPDLERPGAITQKLRDAQFDSKETQDDHLMHVVGIAKDEEGGTYYLTKNSWGAVGPHQGYLYMSKNYVALKMLGMMVHKDGLPSEIKEKSKN
jgi:bleomycin hydrolase